MQDKLWGLKCTSCGHEFEWFGPYEKLPEVIKEEVCAECGAPLSRLWTFGMGTFKGPGFTTRSTN